MAKKKPNTQNRQGQEISKDSVKTLFDMFMKSANEYDLRSINTFLTNKLSNDRDIRQGTIVVVARNRNVRDIAYSITLMDNIIVEGQKGVGDISKGEDMMEYATKFVNVAKSYKALAEQITATTTEAVKNEIGPIGAILRHLQDEIQHTYDVSEKQSRRLVSEYRNEKRKNAELTVEAFMKPYKEQAEKENITIKELLIKQANEKAKAEAERQKAEREKQKAEAKNKNQAPAAQKGEQIQIVAGAKTTTVTVGELQPVAPNKDAAEADKTEKSTSKGTNTKPTATE